MTKLVEQGAGLTTGQENSVNELLKNRDELLSERDRLLDDIVRLRNDLEDSHTKLGDYEKKIQEGNDVITQVDTRLFILIGNGNI